MTVAKIALRFTVNARTTPRQMAALADELAHRLAENELGVEVEHPMVQVIAETTWPTFHYTTGHHTCRDDGSCVSATDAR